MIQAVHMPDFKMLVAVLAATDVLWVPFRHRARQTTWHPTAIFERREEYGQGGLSFVGGGSAAARQQHSRALADARREKLVTGREGNRPLVQLTGAGLAIARSLAGCFLEADSWHLLAAVQRLGKAGISNAEHVPEYALLGKSPTTQLTSPELVGLEIEALPLLVAGLLESDSDGHGHVGYKLTDAGRAALAGEPPAVPSDLPRLDESLADHYDDEFKRGLEARETWEPLGRDLVIPLSAGLWPEFRPRRQVRPPSRTSKR
jgi:hypothetical protein